MVLPKIKKVILKSAEFIFSGENLDRAGNSEDSDDSTWNLDLPNINDILPNMNDHTESDNTQGNNDLKVTGIRV